MLTKMEPYRGNTEKTISMYRVLSRYHISGDKNHIKQQVLHIRVITNFKQFR